MKDDNNMHNASGIMTYLMRIWLNRTKIADDFSAVIASMLHNEYKGENPVMTYEHGHG